MSDGYTFTLDEAARKYAQEYLNETEEKREAALSEIKKWLREDRQDLHARLEDKYVLPFLRGCKFNIEKTKKKLENYYIMRRDRPEWFCNRDPLLPEIQELVRLGVFVPLRQRFENRLVVIIKAAAHDTKRHSQDNVFKTGKMILDVAALEDETVQIYGVTALFDLNGLGVLHSRVMTPNVIKKAVFAWQNYHCRPKQLEFINAPFFVNVVLNIFKSFMSEKLKKRVGVHYGGSESLHQVVDSKILPPEYGGEGDDMEYLVDYWSQRLASRRSWFLDDEQYKAE